MAPCVLIVDDEPVILEVLVDMLSNKGNGIHFNRLPTSVLIEV